MSLLIGPDADLKIIHSHFSFKDKGAESILRRFKQTIIFKEKAIYAQLGEIPDDFMSWKKDHIKKLQSDILVFAGTMTDKGLDIPTGLISSLLTFAKNNNLQITMEDKRDFDVDRRILKGEQGFPLRRPQQEALDILTDINRKTEIKGMGLIRLATGTGKTQIFVSILKHFGCPSIFLVPSISILKQTMKRFETAFGSKNVKAYGGGKKTIGYITVATYQSVYRADPKDFEQIQLVTFDEVHHVSADTFYDVAMVKLKHCVHRYGLTAFEERADGSTILVEAACGPVIYQYDAPEAIADGYLAKPTFVFYNVEKTKGSWTKYKIDPKTKKREAVKVEKSVEYDKDDDMIAYRNWVLGNDILNEFVAAMTNSFVKDGKSVLILVDEKEHGDRLVSLIPGMEYCTGGNKNNEDFLKEFNKRKLKALCGTSCLSEGTDLVPVDVLICLQGGAGKSRTLQAYGRALRNETDENGIARKPTTLIVDFSFPSCKILDGHSSIREKIAKELGDVHKETF